MLAHAPWQSRHEHVVQALRLEHIVKVILQDKQGSLAVDVLQEIIHHVSLVVHTIGIEQRTVVRQVFAVVADDAVGQRRSQPLYAPLGVFRVLGVEHGITGEDIVVLGAISLCRDREMPIKRPELYVARLKEKLRRSIVEACYHGRLDIFGRGALKVETAITDNSGIGQYLLAIDHALQVNFLYGLWRVAQTVAGQFAIDDIAARGLCHASRRAKARQGQDCYFSFHVFLCFKGFVDFIVPTSPSRS